MILSPYFVLVKISKVKYIVSFLLKKSQFIVSIALLTH